MNWGTCLRRPSPGQSAWSRRSGEELVGLGVPGEPFGLGVHLQELAERGGGLGEVHTIGAEVRLHPLEAVEGIRVAFQLFAHLLRRSIFAEAVGDVAGVAKGAGQMAFQDVRVQIRDLAAADGVDEVLVVV